MARNFSSPSAFWGGLGARNCALSELLWEVADAGQDAETTGGAFNVFMLRANWFSLDQTEGDDFVQEVKSPEWDAETALAALQITEVPFEGLLGNVLGYATGRKIAVGTLNPLKHKTRFHEMAHVVLGHTEQLVMSDTETLPRDIMEAEAEGVAYVLCTVLDLPGQAESRHYIQGWLDGKDLPEKKRPPDFGCDRQDHEGRATRRGVSVTALVQPLRLIGRLNRRCMSPCPLIFCSVRRRP